MLYPSPLRLGSLPHVHVHPVSEKLPFVDLVPLYPSVPVEDDADTTGTRACDKYTYNKRGQLIASPAPTQIFFFRELKLELCAHIKIQRQRYICTKGTRRRSCGHAASLNPQQLRLSLKFTYKGGARSPGIAVRPETLTNAYIFAKKTHRKCHTTHGMYKQRAGAGSRCLPSPANSRRRRPLSIR